ncbi:hypothetical protein BDV95DRAFT_559909 [Massariosphaeria phaeospora]|uniref:DUF7924 domain-containing protein n=1 Tax=Massariosphaeria phaeospora TaxID=100035 RepID=A0A7C8MV37_9PLEO|nr:hypothetical protein BDV95DRAFT_559909 [Massariosphaeria phaeospora]
MYFPFMTGQWKRSQNHTHALPQGARDGAVIVNYLRSFFKEARGDKVGEPGVTETCHFSITFDGWLVMVWVHWYDAKSGAYNMESILDAAVNNKLSNIPYRAFLRNLQDHAMGSRLETLKDAVDQLREHTLAEQAQSSKPARAKRAKTSTDAVTDLLISPPSSTTPPPPSG